MPRNESIKLKILKTNGSLNAKADSNNIRSRSAIGGVPRQIMKTEVAID